MAISNSYVKLPEGISPTICCIWVCLKMSENDYTIVYPPNCYLDTSGNLTMVVTQTASPSMRIGWSSSVHPILEPVLSGVWKLGVPPNSWHVKVGNYGEPLDFGVSHFQVPIFQIKLDVCVISWHTYIYIYIYLLHIFIFYSYSSNIPMSHPFFPPSENTTRLTTRGTSSDALGGARPPGAFWPCNRN